MKFNNEDFNDVVFDDVIVNDVIFYLHPKEGGRFGMYLEINEKEQNQLAKILKNNNITFEIQKKSSLF